MKPGTVVIKKYGNRRLYDTVASRYVNLDDIARFVRERKELRVVDAKTGQDLSHAYRARGAFHHATQASPRHRPSCRSLSAEKADAGSEGAMVESAEGEELGRVDVVVDEVRIASSGNVSKTATDRPVASAKFEALLEEQIE